MLSLGEGEKEKERERERGRRRGRAILCRAVIGILEIFVEKRRG